MLIYMLIITYLPIYLTICTFQYTCRYRYTNTKIKKNKSHRYGIKADINKIHNFISEIILCALDLNPSNEINDTILKLKFINFSNS